MYGPHAANQGRIGHFRCVEQYLFMAKEADENGKGAQIDLLIDRNDQVVNICEMKYSLSEFTIDADYERNLRNKRVRSLRPQIPARLCILQW